MKTLTIRTQDTSVQHICENDPLLNRLITIVGDLEVPMRTDYLASLVRSIVGQQISVNAASTIYGRLKELLGGDITVNGLRNTSPEQLRQAGLTVRKAEYVKDLADKIVRGELDLDHIDQYDDMTVKKQLMNVKGIGRWTAEMFLLLTLGREDVLPVDDVGIQRAAKWLYGVEKAERRNILIEKSSLWKPYRSIASFYLWNSIHQGFLTEYESIDEVEKEKKLNDA